MSQRFDLVNLVMEEALELDLAERKAFVAARCGSDDDLTAEVKRLLALESATEGALDFASTSSAEIRPGDWLGERFRIIAVAAAGATGSVFLAEDRQLGEVAIKVLHPEMRGDQGAVERFLAEVRIARAVRHPNVCPVFDLFTFDDSRGGTVAGFTMQYLGGETLACRLLRGAIPPAEAMLIARGIAAGLDALHALGIVHRDLKPGNIMLTTGPDGNLVPVILDFGLASRSETGAARAAVVAAPISGSPDYMAPEQFRTATVAKSADIYAFGLILFEMVAGARPFPNEELLPAVIRRATEEAPRLSSAAPWLSDEWDAAMARALSRDVSKRPASAGEMLDEMERQPARGAPRKVVIENGCRHRRPGIIIDRARSARRTA